MILITGKRMILITGRGLFLITGRMMFLITYQIRNILKGKDILPRRWRMVRF